MTFTGFLQRSLTFCFDHTGFALISSNTIWYVPFDARFFSPAGFFSISSCQLKSTVATFRSFYLGLRSGHFCVLHAKGIGFRIYFSFLNWALYFFLGYNHLTKYLASARLRIKTLKGHLLLYTLDSGVFGTSVYQIRHLRFPDPYRGKGIRYRYQIMNFKPGKQR
jgi:ribosomal protein L6P/L9E